MKVDEMRKKLSEKAEKDPGHHWRHAQHDMNTKMLATLIGGSTSCFMWTTNTFEAETGRTDIRLCCGLLGEN